MNSKNSPSVEDEFFNFEFENANSFKAEPTAFYNDGTFWRMRSNYNLGFPGEHIGLWFVIPGRPNEPLRGTFKIGLIADPEADAFLFITQQISQNTFEMYDAQSGEIQLDIHPGAVSTGTVFASLEDLKLTGSFRTLEHPLNGTFAQISSGNPDALVQRLKK